MAIAKRVSAAGPSPGPDLAMIAPPPLAARAGELGQGRALEQGVRSRMERSLGHSFADVRIHDDPAGAALATRAGATAVTVGSHVAFAPGTYRPGSLGGDALLAHELAHVAQQDPARAPERGGDLESERDANRAAVDALSPGRTPRGVRRRGGPAMRMSSCSPEPIRPQQDLLTEGASTRAAMTAEFGRRHIDPDAPTGEQEDPRARSLRLSAQVMQWNVDQLDEVLRRDLAEATTDEQRRRAQQRYLERMGRLRRAFAMQLDLEARYGIPIRSGTEKVGYGVAPHREEVPNPMTWSLEELQLVDQILSRVPDRYLVTARGRIRQIRREATGGMAAAAWEETTGSIILYDGAMERPQEVARILLHEIGHSTYTQETVGDFREQPPADWMRLSDWRRHTSASLAGDLGISEGEAIAMRRLLGETTLRPPPGVSAPTANPNRCSNEPQPTGNTVVSTNLMQVHYVNGRGVVPDMYERTIPRTRFYSFALAHDGEFVSAYARMHPGEDLAETFARYLQNADSVRSISDPKYQYMRAHYPAGLTGPLSLSSCG